MSTLIPVSTNPRGRNLIIYQTVFIFLDILAVCGRVWARRLKDKRLAFNDWSIIVALVIMTGRYATEISMVLVAGFGLQSSYIVENYGPDKLIQFGKMSFANDMMWISLITIIKLSILHLYVTIFRQPWFVKVCWATFALVAATGVSFVFVEGFICRPVDLFWDRNLPGSCGNTTIMYQAIATIDLILDLIVGLLPVPVLWNLRMPVVKKVALTGIFCITAGICGITAVRLRWVSEIDPLNATYTQLRFNIFAALEPLLGIINCCLPVLPPVISKFWHNSAFESIRHKSGHGGGSSGTYGKGYGPRTPGVVSTVSTNIPSERSDDQFPLTEVKKGEGSLSEQLGIQVETQLDIEFSSGKLEHERSNSENTFAPGLPHAL